MKLGDLVRLEGYLANGYTWVMPSLGIYLGTVRYDDLRYSPAFPSCDVLTPRGIKMIGLERVKFL